MPISLDSDGFLRRECPHCEQEFKWHHGRIDGTPADWIDPDIYWCPRCGASAGHDAWWTQDQVAYQESFIEAVAPDVVTDALADAFRGSRHIKFQREPRVGLSTTPAPPAEPDDMEMIASPCHPWEPVKVSAPANSPYYCLVCGEPYAV